MLVRAVGVSEERPILVWQKTGFVHMTKQTFLISDFDGVTTDVTGSRPQMSDKVIQRHRPTPV